MRRKKITKIILGTNNAGKLKEIRDLLPKNLAIYSPKSLKIKSPKESGNSFKENSLIKAKYFSKKSKMVCLADDSGLEIDILNNKEAGTIVQEIQKGFKMKDRLLRPSLVAVSKKTEKNEEKSEEKDKK